MAMQGVIGQDIDNAIETDRSLQGKVIGEGNAVISTDAYSRAQIFCDDFNRSNSTTVTGWTEQSGDWQVAGNMLMSPGISIWQYITANGTSQADGCVTLRAVYGSPIQLKFVGAVARYTGNNSHIMFKIQDNSSSGHWDSYWLYTGGLGGSVSFSLTGQNFGTDATIQLEYTGGNVTARIDTNNDGTWDYTQSGTTSLISAGLCGVGGYGNAYSDDFCCGNDCSFEEVPLSNIGLLIALGLLLIFITWRVYRRA